MSGDPRLLPAMTLAAATAVAIAAAIPAAGADEVDVGESKILFVCDDASLGEEGGCAALRDAIAKEMEDVSVSVETGAIPPAGLESAGASQPPEGVEAAVEASGAIGAIWVTGSCLSLFLPGMLQPLSAIPLSKGDGDAPDAGDAAFRIRSLVSAALHPDLLDLEPPGLPAAPYSPAFAPLPGEAAPPATGIQIEKMEAPPAPAAEVEIQETADLSPKPRRPWLRASAAYSFLAYPGNSASAYVADDPWYHAIALRVSLLPAAPASPAAGLEIFLDGAFSFPRHVWLEASLTDGPPVGLDNSQYLVGLGLGWTFAVARAFSVATAAGLHLGLSRTDVAVEDRSDSYVQANGSAWTGVELRVMPARWVAFTIGFSMENLFNYEYFKLRVASGEVRVFGLSQLRLDVSAGACFTF